MVKITRGASRQPLVALRLDSVTMVPVGNGPTRRQPLVVLHLDTVPHYKFILKGPYPPAMIRRSIFYNFK